MKNYPFGLPERTSSQAQEFGTRFHDYLLLNSASTPTGKGATATKRMLDAVRANGFFAQIVIGAEIETPQFWNDETTGLPLQSPS